MRAAGAGGGGGGPPAATSGASQDSCCCLHARSPAARRLCAPPPRSDGTAKVADVGLAKIIAQEYSAVTGAVGTLAWVSDSKRAGPWRRGAWRRWGGECCWAKRNAAPPACMAAALIGLPAHPPRPHPQSSPEMLLGARCTEKSDIYSYGGWVGGCCG